MNATEWIAQRRELLWPATEGPWAPWLDQDGAKHMNGLLMVGNADAVIPDGEVYIEGVDVNPVAHTYTPEDRAFIADARTSLPAALDALEAVLTEHEPKDYGPLGIRCRVCFTGSAGYAVPAPYPCSPVRAIESALRGDRGDHV